MAVDQPAGPYTPLEVGEYVATSWDRYYWHTLPKFAQGGGVPFWQVTERGHPCVDDGVASFRVLSDGPVLMACT